MGCERAKTALLGVTFCLLNTVTEPKEVTVVCTENSILVDYVTESPNVSGDDRAALLLPGPVHLALQVEEPA